MALPKKEVPIITFDRIVTWVAGLTALYELIVASRVLSWFHIFFPAAQHRALSLTLVLFLVYALRTPGGQIRSGPIPWYDVVLLVCGWAGAGYVAFNYRAVIAYSSYGYLDTKGLIL